MQAMLHRRSSSVKRGNSSCRQRFGLPPGAGGRAHAGVHITQNRGHKSYHPENADMHEEASGWQRRMAAGWRHTGFWCAGCAPAFPGPLGGGEVGTIRPRSERAHGWVRLFARAGDGMDAGVEATQERLPESARKARDRLTDVPSMDGRNEPTGVSFPLGYFSLTPGILPSAPQISFAVRRRSCGGVDKQKRSHSGAGRRTKRL